MKKIFVLIMLSMFSLGSIHADITWNLSGDGTLTISGTDMPSYYSPSAPWYGQSDNIKKVIIKNGVTNIGDHAFSNCRFITSVTIPNSVTNIGYEAFSECYGLTSIAIPYSVTNIGDEAFHGCFSLTSVTIPKSVKKIGCRAFWGCTRLTSISIPNSVTEIGQQAFYGCRGLTSIIIPNSVTVINAGVFEECTGLTSVIIPNSIRSIVSSWSNDYEGFGGAFQGCTSLTSISIPNSVKGIGADAFKGCKGLASVTIPNSVTIIDEGAFSNCTSLASITIPNSVKTIAGKAFSGCTSLTSITIPNSVTEIGQQAFYGCRELNSITIPNSVTNIEYNPFPFCRNLTSINVESGNAYFDSRNNCNAIIRKGDNTLVSGCENTIIPNSVTCIGAIAFEGCEGLTSITIPNSVTSIECSAFEGCEGLTSVSIPNSVTYIGDDAFGSCTSLTSVTIPNSVTYIGEYAFNYCLNLKSITINVNKNLSMEYCCFCSCNPETIILNGEKLNTSELSFTNATLYVPSSLYNEYKSTSPWKEFKNIQPIINTETYTVSLDHNKGNGDPEQITVTYNEPMPENIGLVAPTRKGYDFTGYSRNETYYYDANLKSVRNFDKQEDYTLYASWKARTSNVTLNPQGGQNGTAQVTATYAKAMPTDEDIVAPTRAGYTFEGYYTSTNGNGTQYYNADMTSTRSWYRDASTATLYAYWKPSTIPVASIALSETEAALWVGKAKTITATVNPTDASNTAVAWSSSNTQVATVTTKGVVKAIGKGTCIITCTAADGYGTKAECVVTVKQQVTSIDFGYETLSVTCGTTKTLKPKIYPSDADVQTLTWRSKNTSVAKVSSEGVLTAVAPGTAQIICTATDGFWKADTITVEVVPLKITDSKPTIADGTYGAGGISYTRTLTEGKYAAFCLPYNVNLNDYTEEFSKVFVPMGMTFLKTNGTLMVIFKNVSMTETIRAGKPFVALAAKSGAMSIVNDAKKTFTDLTNPTPTDLDVYNWNGSNGFLTLNSDITVQMGGTYSKLTGLDSEKYYMVSTGGSIGKATSISPYRIYIYKDDNNSNAKVTEIIFSFDEDEMVTGVENIRNEQKGDGKYYNLNGQRINKSNAQKGVYIINGKKVVVK